MASNHQDFEQATSLFGANSVYIEQQLERYLQNPSSVDESWQQFFSTLGDDKPVHQPSWGEAPSQVIGVADPHMEKPSKKNGKAEAAAQMVPPSSVSDSTRVFAMIHAYRHRGHLIAQLDPLEQHSNKYHPELDPKTYGFGPEDYDRPIFLDGTFGRENATLNEILDVLRRTYCQTVGVEYMHIQYPEQREWIQSHMENVAGKPNLSNEEKHEVLDNLIEVEAFEGFLHTKYPGVKRFSIQGGDAAIAGLQIAIQESARRGIEEIVIGMPHRGRLNVLTTVMGKPYAEMFSLFHGNMDFPDDMGISGDVKYHIGTSSDREIEGKSVHLSLTANPSHLEAVNPVVCGKTRAKQDQIGDNEKTRAMGIMLHGDAAFAGQGPVAETLSLSELRGYRTGGSLHMIVNNQIGFTTSPKFARFTPYPSDVAKMVQAPIFHVNGDDAEAVAWVCKLAVEFRQTFQRDVVVDVICYRKYGHNEGDEPMFTQPLMYKKIKEHEPPSTIYANRLIRDGIVSEEDVKKEFEEFHQFFEEQYEVAKEFRPNNANWLEGHWSGFEKPKSEDRIDPDTGYDVKKLKKIGKATAHYPEDFAINRKLARILKAREEMMASGEGLDCAAGELLAYGSLLEEGHAVRLSGQDCERGTFSHRHSVLIDQENGDRFTPFHHMKGRKAEYEVINSSLSEMAILGFEYGYSLAEPGALTLWEAQFGDFANGAQVIIDQFIASGEIKWLRMSGLVMLLPHGYEGQGPEHSSARLERFLQLCGEDNMQVVNCTTPANYFHVLRRQLHQNFRKPLIVMTPKSLLRHKLATSTLDEMAPGTSFKKLIPEHEKLVADSKIRRVVLCSGKVYYDLLQARDERGIKDIAIVRVEQYYPFPAKDMKKELKRYKNAEVVWCQEEPENTGAWWYIAPRIGEVMDAVSNEHELLYAGRKEAASPATGYFKIHEQEQQNLVNVALADISKKRKTG